ncbi:hypothetical protein JOY44_18020 [Phormidium sp. CLA17]|uniref:hypothetical protein n=1 Tax=Leptolyngbya sp. Cla-17 TaxID=2803751 RepID=UPI00149280E7|nr:hypothetical protein [Leptolyngbya sp. Cla-17]MBM0743485.1 hypothetical protein [Leptolyngbya sp. Cla-17]
MVSFSQAYWFRCASAILSVLIDSTGVGWVAGDNFGDRTVFWRMFSTLYQIKLEPLQIR